MVDTMGVYFAIQLESVKKQNHKPKMASLMLKVRDTRPRFNT